MVQAQQNKKLNACAFMNAFVDLDLFEVLYQLQNGESFNKLVLDLVTTISFRYRFSIT